MPFSLSVTQLLTPITSAQFRAYAVSLIQSMGPNPNNWKQGGIASSVLTAMCNALGILSGGGQVAGTTIGGLSNAIAQQWNPTATGAGLQLLSYYFYGFTPPLGTFASGQVTLTNSGGGVYSYGPNQIQFVSSVANGQGVYPTYTNENTVNLNPFETLTGVEIECGFSGSGGNASPNTISLVTQMLGVTATNPGAVLGSDALSDPILRQMNINSLSRQAVLGPRNSYAYAIQTATNIVTGAPVNINRWNISQSSHNNTVTIYVSGPSGTTDPNDVEGAAACIESGYGSTDPTFFGARPPGITVLPNTVTLPDTQVIGSPAAATPVDYDPSVTVYVYAPVGTLPATVLAAINTALDNWFGSPNNPIGGLTGYIDGGIQMTGILESGITGVIGQGVGTVNGCLMISTDFSGVSNLSLLTENVAVNEMTVSVVLSYYGGP